MQPMFKPVIMWLTDRLIADDTDNTVHVPGRDYCLGLLDSDRPSGLPGWLWQTGWDPPTPGAPPDC